MTGRSYAPPKQDRSRGTYRRILEATEILLRTKTFNELTIAEIVGAAGCSEGPFYARFGDKEGFLDHLEQRFFSEREIALEKAAAIGRSEASDRYERLCAMIGVMIGLYREHAGVHRALLMLSRQDPELGARMERWERSNLGRAAKVLAAGADGPLTDEKLEMALFVLRSTVREIVLFRGEYSTGIAIPDDALAAELATLLVSYLDSREHPEATRS